MENQQYAKNQTEFAGQGYGRPLTQQEIAGLPQGQNVGQAALQAGSGLLEGANTGIPDPIFGGNISISPLDALMFGGGAVAGVTKLAKGTKLVRSAAETEKILKVGEEGFDLSRNGYKIIEEAGLGKEAADLSSKRIGKAEAQAISDGRWNTNSKSKILDTITFQTARKYGMSKTEASILAEKATTKAGLPAWHEIEKGIPKETGKYLESMSKHVPKVIQRRLKGGSASFLVRYVIFRSLEHLLTGLVTDKQASPSTIAQWYADGVYDTDAEGNPRTPPEALAEFSRELDTRDLGDEKQGYLKIGITAKIAKDDDKERLIEGLQIADMLGIPYNPLETPQERVGRAKTKLNEQTNKEQQQAAQQQQAAFEAAQYASEVAKQITAQYGQTPGSGDFQKFLFENKNEPLVQAYQQAVQAAPPLVSPNKMAVQPAANTSIPGIPANRAYTLPPSFAGPQISTPLTREPASTPRPGPIKRRPPVI